MKKYTIVAGVNGAGKTTLYDAEQLQKTEYRINADDIKKTILCNVQKDQLRKAARFSQNRGGYFCV